MRRQVRITAECSGRVSSLTRRVVETTVVTIVVLALAMTWQIQCFVVSGASMAETLLGQHRQLTCGNCGREFRCADDEPIMFGKRAVCPNCGDTEQRLDKALAAAGDAVVVDRSAFELRSPERWELAAFRAPGRPTQIYVKRIVGLPGEAIELRHGDVYADGKIQRKTLKTLRSLAVAVHEAAYDSPAIEPRWQPDEPQSGWRRNGSRFWRPATAASQEGAPIDWLTYHHRERQPAGGTAEGRPVADDCGYNQLWPVAASHLVRDLLVRCRMRCSPRGRVLWLLTDGRSQFLVTLDRGRRTVTVSQDGRQIDQRDMPADSASDDILCELAVCDEQVLVGLNGREVAAVPYDPPDAGFHPTSRPVAVGSQGDEIEVWDVALLRDVYYVGSAGRGNAAQDRLAADEYFMLGDNSPRSGDSREWSRPGVPSYHLIGKPFAAFPSGLLSREGGSFQVPDSRRFRYIH
ncbi:MAG TPA: S26 family signal peptidase [Pirellulales bacterium]|nr:S26 family signal peptidase [Pirellulales bacterium]